MASQELSSGGLHESKMDPGTDSETKEPTCPEPNKHNLIFKKTRSEGDLNIIRLDAKCGQYEETTIDRQQQHSQQHDVLSFKKQPG